MKRKNVLIYIAIAVLATAFLYLGGRSPKNIPVAGKSLPVSVKEKTPARSADSVPIKYPNLRLEGTLVTGNKPAAYIRKLDSGQADYYSAGDRILNAVLVEIKRGNVLLDVAGYRYRLFLASAAADKGPFEEVSESFRIVEEKGLLNIVNANTQGLRAFAEITPCRNNGVFIGYKVGGVKPASLAHLAGLRNGDIINRLNGQELLSQQKTIQTFRTVRQLKSIEIGLVRNSEKIDLKYMVK